MPTKTTCRKLSLQDIELLAARFRILGEVSRLQLLLALESGAKNVSQLVKATGLNQPNTSRHLRALTDAGVLVRHREKTEIYYAPASPGIYELLLKVSRGLKQRAKIKPWPSP